MKLELNADEVRDLLMANIQKLIPVDITQYDVEIETQSKYSSNPGGVEIMLRRKADPVPVAEAA